MEKTVVTAIVIAAVSFVLQKTLNNIIYGFVIFLTRPFKKGDKIIIKQSGREIASGNVVSRGILHVKVKDYNRNVCVIPNSVLENCTVLNSDYKSGVNYINQVKISFASDIPKAKGIIMDSILSHEQTENTAENTHIICKSEEQGVVIEYNVRTPDVVTSFDVCSDIVEDVVTKLNASPDVELI